MYLPVIPFNKWYWWATDVCQKYLAVKSISTNRNRNLLGNFILSTIHFLFRFKNFVKIKFLIQVIFKYLEVLLPFMLLYKKSHWFWFLCWTCSQKSNGKRNSIPRVESTYFLFQVGPDKVDWWSGKTRKNILVEFYLAKVSTDYRNANKDPAVDLFLFRKVLIKYWNSRIFLDSIDLLIECTYFFMSNFKPTSYYCQQV